VVGGFFVPTGRLIKARHEVPGKADRGFVSQRETSCGVGLYSRLPWEILGKPDLVRHGRDPRGGVDAVEVQGIDDISVVTKFISSR
jgi:hypothetical protein